MSWLLAFLGFAALVVLHELGHYAAAKAVGMRVERFALFFPPILAKVRRGETEYAIGAIPLGGYVRITGMNPEEELEPELRARSYSGSPVWKRIVVIAAGPLVNLVIALVILTIIFTSQGKPVPGVEIGQVEPGTPAAQVLREGDLITGVTGPAPGGSGVERIAVPAGEDADPDLVAERRTQLIDLIAVAGCPGSSRPGVDEPLQLKACADPATFQVTVDRGGRQETVPITPAYDGGRERYRLGVAFQAPMASVGPVEGVGLAATGMWRVTTATVSAIARIAFDTQARKEVSSVVGGYEATRQSIEVDPVLAWQLIAFISLSLAIINLFPFLPLDGGHIFWAIVEKLRGGKRVSTATLERASFVGLLLVLLLFSVGLTNDIGRIVSGEGFGIR